MENCIGPSRQFLPDIQLQSGRTLFYPVDSKIPEISERYGFDVKEALANPTTKDLLTKCSTTKCPLVYGDIPTSSRFYNGLRKLNQPINHENETVDDGVEIINNTVVDDVRYVGINGLIIDDETLNTVRRCLR
jgi:hypothetical protein